MSAVPPVEVFAALGNPDRQRLLDVVAQGGGSAADMASLLDITRQAVLNRFPGCSRRPGLVQRVHLGRRVRFAVRTEALAETATWLSSLADTWDRRLAAVKALSPRPDVRYPLAPLMRWCERRDRERPVRAPGGAGPTR